MEIILEIKGTVCAYVQAEKLWRNFNRVNFEPRASRIPFSRKSDSNAAAWTIGHFSSLLFFFFENNEIARGEEDLATRDGGKLALVYFRNRVACVPFFLLFTKEAPFSKNLINVLFENFFSFHSSRKENFIKKKFISVTLNVRELKISNLKINIYLTILICMINF